MRSIVFALIAANSLAGLAFSEEATPASEKPKPSTPGYTNTPLLPDGKWRVHDAARPHPDIIAPGKSVSDAPEDAIVLFDGTSLDQWEMAGSGKPAIWELRDGYMEVSKKKPKDGRDLQTKQEFGDIQLHLEFFIPESAKSSQAKGNSGVFLAGAYEIQILNSFENLTYADGQASAMYGYRPPLVNAARPPAQWQSYDIIFEVARFDEAGELLKPATVTVFHNGVLTQYHQEFIGATTHKKVATYEKKVSRGPIKLQNHGSPVRFRNIWVRELKGL